MTERKPFFIIGYMACGKTTFGRALARKLDRQFIDLDFYIEQRFRKRIPEIFAERGEEGFRQIERNLLQEVGEFDNVVISCGGGTPCFFDNMDYMSHRGVTIWLQATEARITERLLVNNANRPLIKGKSKEEIEQTVAKGLSEREEFYSRAGIHFSGEYLEDRRQIDSTVEKFLNNNIVI